MVTPEALVLFGAGASAYCGPTLHLTLDGKVTPRCPPLGVGDNGLFRRMSEEGNVSCLLLRPIANIFERDFEIGMAILEEWPENIQHQFIRDISLHLARYTPASQANLYLKLLDDQSLRSNKVLFSSLNYDILFECAALSYGLIPEYKPDDVERVGTIRILKLHGSCNFIPNPGENKVSGNIATGSSYAARGFSGNFRIDTPFTFEDISAWLKDPGNAAFSPITAVYAKGKPFLFNQAAFERLHRYWTSATLTAKNIYIVGVRYSPEDTHIWDPILSTNAAVHIVNRRDNEFETIKLHGRGKPYIWLQNSMKSIGLRQR